MALELDRLQHRPLRPASQLDRTCGMKSMPLPFSLVVPPGVVVGGGDAGSLGSGAVVSCSSTGPSSWRCREVAGVGCVSLFRRDAGLEGAI